MEPSGITRNARLIRLRPEQKVPAKMQVAHFPDGKIPTQAQMEEANLITKAKRLKNEIKVWMAAGAKLVPTAVRKERLSICEKCPYYDPKGNWGLGQCKAPGCGCSRIKLALATSKCPHPDGPRWPEWKPDQGG